MAWHVGFGKWVLDVPAFLFDENINVKKKKIIQYDVGEQRLCCVLLADNQCQKFPQATIYYK